MNEHELRSLRRYDYLPVKEETKIIWHWGKHEYIEVDMYTVTARQPDKQEDIVAKTDKLFGGRGKGAKTKERIELIKAAIIAAGRPLKKAEIWKIVKNNTDGTDKTRDRIYECVQRNYARDDDPFEFSHYESIPTGGTAAYFKVRGT